jgi:rubrerythrin
VWQVGAFRAAFGDRISERAEFRCACGYGIVVSDTPPSCPMCQANVWQGIAVGREAA